ncbi:hypothetical protein XENTR_v10005470 [Xenopus tropicalis]|nr:hypothetical protein XENTR_v10005470 [Xenopus tropicalis]
MMHTQPPWVTSRIGTWELGLELIWFGLAQTGFRLRFAKKTLQFISVCLVQACTSFQHPSCSIHFTYTLPHNEPCCTIILIKAKWSLPRYTL